MNKLTKLGIVTFSAVTLSAAVPTLVHAEENVAPQPNAAARPTIQPTLTPKPNNNWVDYSMLDPIAKPKPKPGKEVSKPAEKPVEEPAPVEKPSTEGNILANGTDEAIAEDKKNAEIEKKYNVDPTNQLPEPGLSIITPEPEQPITDSEEMKKMVAEDLAYKAGAVMSMTKEENDKIVSEANQKLYALSGIDADKLLNTPIPGTNGQGFPTLADWTYREYEVQADFLDADRVQKYGYTTESRIDSPEHATVRSLRFDTDKDDADGILTAKKFSDYTFSHVVKATTDHPDIDPDPKVVRVSYDAAYALRGSGYKNGKGDNLFRYYFIYTKNKPIEEKPTTKDPQPAETEKPAEISKPVETVKPTEQPKPAENKPVEKPKVTPQPAENPQPEVKPAEQPQSTKPVEPAENAGLPKIPYRTNQPKRWFNNGTSRPTLTTNDLAVPLPTENVEKTSYGWWTAEPDLLHAGSHIKVNTFNSNFNNPMFENGKEIKFEGSGFGDMDSRFKPALVRVKVPELEGMNYEAYTIFYEVPNKNGNPTYGTNRTLQGGGIALTFKSKEKKEDIQVYTLTKDKKLEELYFLGYPGEETNRYDEKTKTHSYNLFGETYDTYVFLFKNPAEKPAEQVKPEVKPSEQPKPDKQPSVPTVPADQSQPAKPVKPTPTQSGWSGSSYYQNGVKVTNKWIFDKKYNSYFYLNASGNYVQNAWVGNYYLKSGGYMAKSEWIYDKNYGSYYYLTSEGSYARNTWVGNYYLKSNGKMAKSEWIYDKNYGAYYYLTAEGSYARNAWSGSYYLKSNGKMAKGEWVYDSNYKSYYYLTAEGSYARNTWVGDYYLKSNGKMAVNERTPDGYQVDESGKWIR